MLKEKLKSKTFSILHKVHSEAKTLRMLEAKDKDTEVY